MKLNTSQFHFIGIGGIGMCGLAELLHNMGAAVSGSDLSENANVERLKALGVQVSIGHSAQNVGNVDVVVYSSAVKRDNPEYQEAKRKRIPLIPRAEALAEIMRLKRGVAVAGSHGKTTTTSMVASIFLQARTNPTIVVGGRLDLIQSTALLGAGEWLVAEADESDNSFQKLSPEFAVITNIDNDHLDFFGNLQNLHKAFQDFTERIPFYGACIVCGDDPTCQKIFANYQKPMYFYGFGESNDFRIQGGNGRYEFFKKDLKGNFSLLGEFEVKVPGHHNALNAAAAISTGLLAGFSFEVCQAGLKRFNGVDRRFQFRGKKESVVVYDDYGHHPTEVLATIQAFREKFPKERLTVVFQPHRYSRTQTCWDDFVQSFKGVDDLVITDIYPAGEAPIEGITSTRLAAEIQGVKAQYIPKDQLDAWSQGLIKERGDRVFVTLGAGDIWKVGVQLVKS